MGSTLAVAGDVSVNSGKFTVAAASGDALTSGSLTVQKNVIASIVDAPSSDSGVTVPAGVTVFVISAGAATSGFSLALPAAPADGQLLFIRNQAAFSATCAAGAVAAASGSLFVGSSTSWLQVM